MNKFIVVHCIEKRENVEIIQPFVINVEHIVLIEQEWWECCLKNSKRKDGHLRTKVYVSQSGYKWVHVRETVSELMSMISFDTRTGLTVEYLSKSTQQYVESNQLADDIWWDKEWRDSYGDGRGGEE